MENGYCKAVIAALGDEMLTCNQRWGGGVITESKWWGSCLAARRTRTREEPEPESESEVTDGCDLTTMVKGMKTGLNMTIKRDFMGTRMFNLNGSVR